MKLVRHSLIVYGTYPRDGDSEEVDQHSFTHPINVLTIAYGIIVIYKEMEGGRQGKDQNSSRKDDVKKVPPWSFHTTHLRN